MSEFSQEEQIVGDILEHYGVLGMKWGVRKDGRPRGYGNPGYKGTRLTRKERNDAITKARRAKAEGPKTTPAQETPRRMSTSEMQTEVNRLRLENEYKKLTAAPPSQKNALRRETESILKNVARKQTEYLLNTAIRSSANKFLEKHGIEIDQGKKDKSKKDETPTSKSDKEKSIKPDAIFKPTVRPEGPRESGIPKQSPRPGQVIVDDLLQIERKKRR